MLLVSVITTAVNRTSTSGW